MRKLFFFAALISLVACKTQDKAPTPDSSHPTQVAGCDDGYKVVLISPLASDSLKTDDQSSPLWNDSTTVGPIKGLCIFPATDEDIGGGETIMTREDLSKVALGPVPFPNVKVFKVRKLDR